jgi:hypothetical protein
MKITAPDSQPSRRPVNTVSGITVSGTPSAGQGLVATGSGTAAWSTIMSDPMTTRGDIIDRNASNVTARLGIGAAGKILSSDGTDVSWGNGPMTTQDDIIVGGTSGAPARLGKGSDGQVLTVDPTTHHLLWATPSTGFSNPMTTKGDVILGDTGGTPTRLGAGTSTFVLTSNGAAAFPSWQAGGGGGGGTGGLLAVHIYAPVADGVVNATTSSATFVDVDATNAVVTFTAPASGNILVRLTALHNGNSDYFWGLREATTNITGSSIGMLTIGTTISPTQSVAIYLTGISAGSHTYKWAHRVSAGSHGMYAGPGYGSIVMEVWPAP